MALQAVIDNDCKQLENILKYGLESNINLDNLLATAAFHGHVDIASLLLTYGAEVNAPKRIPLYCHPLYCAACSGHIPMMKFLLSKDVDINDANNSNDNTALHTAVENSHIEAAKLLLNCKGIDITITNKNNQTAADLAKSEELKVLFLNEENVRGKNVNEDKIQRKELFEQLHNLEISAVDKQISQEEANLAIINIACTTINDGITALTAETTALKDKLRDKEEDKSIVEQKLDALLQRKNKLITRKPGDLTIEEESLECPICAEVPLSPTQMFQCSNGHLYCGVCSNNPVMTQCPQCRVSIEGTPIRSLQIEKIIAERYT